MPRTVSHSLLQVLPITCLLAALVVPGVAALAQALPDAPPTAPPAAAPPVMAGDAGPSVSIAPQLPENSPEPANSAPLHIKSLFFSAREMTRLYDALNAFSSQTPNQGNSNLKDEEEEDVLPAKFYTYPQFFLKSLVYHSPADWAVHVNNQKITPETSLSKYGITVVSIDQDKVSFEWKPAPGDRLGDKKNIVEGGAVRYNSTEGILTFTLHPNQTFSAFAMRVLEGKVNPVVIDNNGPLPDAKAPADTAPPPNTGIVAVQKPKAPTEEPGSREGLGGLIDAYKSMKRE